jgi:hypothetical protein
MKVNKEGRTEMAEKEVIEGGKRMRFISLKAKQIKRIYLSQLSAAVLPVSLGLFFCFLHRDFIWEEGKRKGNREFSPWWE